MRIASGKLDRRIAFEENTGGRDAAGDTAYVWTERFKRWAAYSIPRRILVENQQAQVTTRDSDIDWHVRQDDKTLTVAPENWSIYWRGQRYFIVGIIPSAERLDFLIIRTSVRPDKRGSLIESPSNAT